MRRVLTLSALLLLAACGNPPAEAPRELPPPAAGTAPVAAAAGTYVVQQGDTIYTIARQLHVSVRALIDANQMQPPFQVWAGQKLTLPGSGFYVVSRGENLTLIAKKTGVPFATLARMNGLSPPYVLQVGQKLALPASASGDTQLPAPVVADAPPAFAQQAAIAAPTASAAPQPSITVSSLPPLGAPPALSAPAPSAAAPAPVAAGPVSAPVSKPAPQAASLPPVPLPEPPANSGHGFIWPLKGEVIAAYGAIGKGQNNDGINISAARGTPVVAAESGVVAYAGNELRGFGNLLLIKHEGGWMTAYAHNDILLVKRGDVVKRGQKIAKVGDSGGVSRPQLHFEVRQANHPIDPATVLGGTAIPATAPLDPSTPG